MLVKSAQMKKLIVLLFIVMGLLVFPTDVLAQKKKPKAKTDPMLTISKKKSKKVKKKIVKRKSRAAIDLRKEQNLPYFWMRKEDKSA